MNGAHLTRPDVDSKACRVAILGASLRTGNRGVSALAASLSALIWRVRPDAAIDLMIGSRDSQPERIRSGSGFRCVETVTYRLSPRAPLQQQIWWICFVSLVYRSAPFRRIRLWIARSNPWVRTALEANFVGDIRGGDSFSDIYGLAGFLSGCLPVLSVIWIRGNIDLFPQTFGPFRSRMCRYVARYILLHANSIWCRDRASLAEVTRLTGGRRSGVLCPDVAFTLAPSLPDRLDTAPEITASKKGGWIGLNVSGLLYHSNPETQTFGLRLEYRRFLPKLVADLLADGSNRVLLVPHTFAPDGAVESDPAACRELVQHIPPSLRDRVHVLARDYDQHDLKGIIGLCDFFIGSRMHACIAALSQGVPAVGVAYSRKFAGVFDTVGAGDWVIDARTCSDDEALERIGSLFSDRALLRTLLKGNVASVQDEVLRVFGSLFGTSSPRNSPGGWFLSNIPRSPV
jgi:polysaccharide pyruvyl transferase WcaK-like protein